jgi:hypothetical protein
MTSNRKAQTFLAIAFVISWSSLVFAWLGGARSVQEAGGAVGLFALGPSIAAVACALAFEKGHRISSLGLGIRPNRWWVIALLIMAAEVLYQLLASRAFFAGRLQFAADPRAMAAQTFRVPVERLPPGASGDWPLFSRSLPSF